MTPAADNAHMTTATRAEEVAVLRSVTRTEVLAMVDAGAQLAEVLPEGEYREEHLPGAVHLPLKGLTEATAAGLLDLARSVVVYCWDGL